MTEKIVVQKGETQESRKQRYAAYGSMSIL